MTGTLRQRHKVIMRNLKILHGRVAPPGIEWLLLRNLAWAMLAATLMPLLVAVGARVFMNDPHSAGAAKTLVSIDILCIAVGITAWTAIFTVAIGCVVVHIKKGPAYVADSLEMEGD